MNKKFFIGVGTWKYKREPLLNLPAAQEALEKVVSFFTGRLGYEPTLEEISANPSSYALRKKLDKWFAAKGRDDSDWIVLYYTGHGKLEPNDELYLLTTDYESDLTPSTSFPVNQIAAMLVSRNASGENRRAKRFLLILDTCFSGASAVPLAQGLRARFSQGVAGPMFYVLASAMPTDEALAGGLASALIASLEDKSLGGAHQRFIYFDELLPAINRRLQFHKAVRLALDAPDEEPLFFPNLHRIPQAPLGATIEEIRRAVEGSEYVSHWNPVSRDVEFVTQSGDFFTGRDRVMTDLAHWLNDPTDYRVRIITGTPGCGKSAILSRIVTTTNPELGAEGATSTGWSKLLKKTTFDYAIHAKGKTVEETLSRIAKSLNVPSEPGRVLAAMKENGRFFFILIDALDEAREPARIATEFLRPLQSLPKVKLLVGTRKEWIPSLGSNVVVLHVDTSEYLEKRDIAQYVQARLGGKSATRRALATAVAERAYPNFLIARLVTEELQSHKRLPAVSNIDFPASVSQAFEQYLERFGKDKDRVRDLLTPLAWAEGGGLPWGALWAPIASAIAGRDKHYENTDIEWLMENAGSFIVETLEQGRSAYRLYHQALADHFRQANGAADAQRAFATALLAAVPDTDSGRDWFNAHAYIRTHLAEHAAAGGMLAELMTDPTFLLAADCTRLLGAINASIVRIPAKLVQTYKAASIHIRTKPPTIAASYLELAARQNNGDLKPTIRRGAPWAVLWAHWTPADSNNVIAIGESDVSVLQTGYWTAGQAVTIVGRENGDVEVWEVATNCRLGIWRSDGGRVNAVGLANTTQGPLVVGVRSKSILFVHDPATGQTKNIETHSDDKDSITAWIVVERDGSWICITAQHSLRIAMWSLPDLALLKEKIGATAGTIYALCLVDYRGRKTLLSGGDYLNRYDDRYSEDDSTLRLWSLNDLTLLWEDGRELDRGHVERIGTATLADRNLAIISGTSKGEVWDLDQTRIVYNDPANSDAWLLYSHRDQAMLLAHDDVATMKVFEAEWQDIPPELVVKPTLHTLRIPGEHLTRITRSGGRDVILTSTRDHVRVWDLDELLGGAKSPPDPPVRSIHSLDRIPGQVIYAGAGNSLEVRDITNGAVNKCIELPKTR